MKPWENKAFAYGVFGTGVFIFLLALLAHHHKAQPAIKPTPPSRNVNVLPNKQHGIPVATPPVPLANGNSSSSPVLPAHTLTQSKSSSSNPNTNTTSSNNSQQVVHKSERKNNQQQHTQHTERKDRSKLVHRYHSNYDNERHYRERREQAKVKKEHFDSSVVRTISSGNIVCSASSCSLMLPNGSTIKPMHTYHGYLVKSITLSHVVIENSHGDTKEINMSQ